MLIGVGLLLVQPAASYFHQWRQDESIKDRQIMLELIEETLSTRTSEAASPKQDTAAGSADITTLKTSQGELRAQLVLLEEQIGELSDRVSKITSRLVSLAETREILSPDNLATRSELE